MSFSCTFHRRLVGFLYSVLYVAFTHSLVPLPKFSVSVIRQTQIKMVLVTFKKVLSQLQRSSPTKAGRRQTLMEQRLYLQTAVIRTEFPGNLSDVC